MHISSLYLSTHKPERLISGQLKIAHDNSEITVELSEADRQSISEICTQAFLAEREKIAEAVLNNTPAYIALEYLVEDAEDAIVEDVEF